MTSRQICNLPENDNVSRIANPAERLSWPERKKAAPDSGAAGWIYRMLFILPM